ncbi:unnamed protein product [Lymnaea stagnalis]|uniref:Methyltransferase domain-containing protein n=1 Tax=Lymnaea stagnalis TaxID=6523 RepID=A0AAV2H1N4_LYMST
MNEVFVAKSLPRILWRLIKMHPPLIMSRSFSTDDLYDRQEKLSRFSYWQSKYQGWPKDHSFDWFPDSGLIVDTILDSLNAFNTRTPMEQRVCDSREWCLFYLDMGCGNSELSSQILAQAKVSVAVVLMDFVSEALHHQRHKMSKIIPLKTESFFCALCADVLHLPISNSLFDLISDKGTMDAILKDRNQGHMKAKVMMSEILRVLAPGGRYFQVSDEDPDTRLLFLEELSQKCCTISNSHAVIGTPVAWNDQSPSDTTILESTKHQSIFQSELSGKLLTRLDIINSAGNIVNFQDISLQGDRHLQASSRNDTKLGTGIIAEGDKINLPQTFSAWSFKVIPNKTSEYFLYWLDKEAGQHG